MSGIHFAQFLRTTRKARGWSQEELAQKLDTSKQVISRYERGERTPKVSVAAKYAEILGVSLNDLMGEVLPDNIAPMASLKHHSVPLVGEVAAGEPILAEQQYDVYVNAPLNADFALIIKGDSMNPTYLEGDVVYIKQQPDIDYDGQIAVVLLDDSATVKHVVKQENGLLLLSDNPAWKPMFKPFNEYNTVRILGKVCGYTRMYKEN